MKQKTTLDLGLFGLLVAFGVLGRWFQPAWFFTPTAAVALFGGYYLRSRSLALLVPLAVLAVSDLLLPTYLTPGSMLAVYGAMLLPVPLGRWLRRRSSYRRLAVSALAPAVAFFVLSNLGVWAFDGMYPRTLAGLGQCYTAALPFFRTMLLGDVLYTAAVFGAYVFASQRGYLPVVDRRPELAVEPVRR